jgi:DNA-binding Lrp family transcriptional regulator
VATSLDRVADERKCEFVDIDQNVDESSGHFARSNERRLPMVQDDIDRDLITLLQANARESTANLARKLGIARTTVVARLARLEREGVIVGYTARLGQDEQRPGVIAHVGIAVEPKRSREVVLRLQAIPELRQLYAVSGEADLIAVLRAASTARLDALLDEIGETDGVRKTTTSVVLAVRVDRGG